MSKIKNKTYTEVGGVELELPFAPDNEDTLQIVETPSGFRVGFLANDQAAVNPLEDCVGYGEIHHHPRSRYGRRDSDYYDILALDQYGSSRWDEDKVQALWKEKVCALPDEVFAPFYPEGETSASLKAFVERCKLQLSKEPAGDYAPWEMIRAAFNRGIKVGDWEFDTETCDQIEELIEPHLTWNWDEVVEQCRKSWRKHAVLLDRYEHGLCKYSVSGAGPSCHWDTSSQEAVWVPDQYAEDVINERAKVYDHAFIEETSYTKGRDRKFNLMVDGKVIKSSDDWHKLWLIAKDIARLRTKAGVPPCHDGDTIATEQIAEQACEIYTKWCNGEVYDVVTQDYDYDGNVTGDYDCCGGYYGTESAEDALTEAMAHDGKDVWQVYVNYGYTDERLEHTACSFKHTQRYIDLNYDVEERDSCSILKNNSTEW